MQNVTMFKWSAKYGFTKFQVYTHSYKKDKVVDGKTVKKEVNNIMVDFTHTKQAMKASNGKMVGNFGANDAYTIRIGISSADITDLANLLAFLKHEKQTFSTVHATNTTNGGSKSLSWFTVEQEEKVFIPGKWEEVHKVKAKSFKISAGGKNIGFTLTLAEAKLIAIWIEKHFI